MLGLINAVKDLSSFTGTLDWDRLYNLPFSIENSDTLALAGFAFDAADALFQIAGPAGKSMIDSLKDGALSLASDMVSGANGYAKIDENGAEIGSGASSMKFDGTKAISNALIDALKGMIIDSVPPVPDQAAVKKQYSRAPPTAKRQTNRHPRRRNAPLRRNLLDGHHSASTTWR
ncbi:hypothetical protein WJX72_009680 [[Myrmecia] bisecta]|uniref:Uncharacterized protein n=1 Tax=[Myrmecia] bisecta TaxID=41462 RepID=A0AAW1PXL3_9CHLO